MFIGFLLFNSDNLHVSNFIASFSFNSAVLLMSQSLIAFPKVKRQVLLCEPEAKQSKDFTDNTMFWVNQDFGIM